MNGLKQNKIYLPIVFLLSWLLLTILSFIFGPYLYNVKTPYVFYSFLFLIHSALLIGYIWGQREEGLGTRLHINYYRIIEISIIISMVYLIVKLILSKGGDVRNFMGTFINAAETYANSNVKHAYLFSYLDIIFTPIYIIAITNTIYSHNKIRIFYRICVYLMILVSIASSVGSATRAGIMQIFVLCFAAFLLSIYKKNFIVRIYHRILIVFIIGITIIGFFIYSNSLINTRGGVPIVNPLTYEPPKENYFLFRIVPEKYTPLINNTSFYISHSYYQLNRALYLPSKGIALGLSNSYFLMDNIEELTGWSWPKEVSYGLRLDNQIGQGYGLYWSTFYTWIASDVTFPGTIIVILFFGYCFSLSLRDSLFSLNPLAVTAFCTLFYFIFHFAFNSPLQDGAGIMTYFIIPFLWLIFRKREFVEPFKSINS
jgi:hypothetical protein